MKNRNKMWEKCFKINSSPPLEVYKTHINFFGSNIYPDAFKKNIETRESSLELLKEAYEIWQEEFGKKKLSK